MPELLDEIRREIDTRIDELRPLVREAESLQRALDALGQASTPPQRNRRRARRTRPSSGSATETARRPRRRTAVRAAVIDYVREHPGSTAGDIAKARGLNRDSLGTRLTQLAKTGELVKAQRGYSAP